MNVFKLINSTSIEGLDIKRYSFFLWVGKNMFFCVTLKRFLNLSDSRISGE